MYCKYCGNELPQSANFCSACGKINEDAKHTAEEQKTSEYFEEPVEVQLDDIFDAERRSLGNSILKFSILGLSFACSFFLSLLGLIFTCVSRSKLRAYIAKFGETSGPATVGKHLGIAALIVSIVMMVFFALYILILIATLAAA